MSIPIKLYSGIEDRKLDLDMLDSHNNARIRKEVEWKDIVKSFKIEGAYKVLEKEDFEQANLKKSKTIDMEELINESDVADAQTL